MRIRQTQTGIRPGFTLIEVLIVIAILVALGALVVVNLLPAKDKADVDLERVQIKAIDGALEQFKLDMRRWPTQEEGLAALSNREVIQDEADKANWRGPYLKSPVSKDKWNHDYIYKNPSDRGEGLYDIISWGPNGQDDDGKGDDITNFDNLKDASGEVATGGDTFAPPSGGSGGG